MNMTFDQAFTSLKIREEWDIVLEYLDAQRESAISDFQNQPDHAGGLELSLRYVHQVRYLDNLDKLYFCPRF